jgi:hypothetical protein
MIDAWWLAIVFPLGAVVALCVDRFIQWWQEYKDDVPK